MIERSLTDYVVHCDYCTYLELFNRYTITINRIEHNGWKVEKINGEWKHKCLNCSGGRRGSVIIERYVR